MDSAAQIQQSLALVYWPRVVGAQAAAASEADSVRDGVLFVRTRSSVWSHELNLHKARLLLNLNRLLGGKIIQDIVFRAQGVTHTEEEPEPDTPSPEELAAVILEPDEKAALRARLQDLYTLENDRIRTAIATRLTLEAKLRRWRLERGWRVCPRCTAVHRTDFPLCPLCRLCR
jgi:predicted nucleic acid-binding Zn ribbon protein